MSGKTFLFQVNVTRDCDLRCTHCYISSDKKAASKFMTEDQFIDVMNKIADFLDYDYNNRNEYKMSEIHVIGGEPTMLGLEFYKNTLPVVKERFSKVNQQIKLSIVTNLMQKRSIEIAKLFDEVSTSYEFNSRFTKPKQEEWWLNNVKTMSETGIKLNVTMAVTKYATNLGADKVLDFFYSKGFKNIHLGFFIPSGDGKTNIGEVFPKFEDTSEFMIQATKWYLEKRLEDKNLYVNPVESMISSCYFGDGLDDIVCPIIPGSLDIDWDGETVSCIEAGGEIDSPTVGNVFEKDIIQIINDRPYKKERRKALVPSPHCIGCPEIEVCKSACGVLHQYWNGDGECPGFRAFILYIKKIVSEGVLPKSVILQEERKNGSRC